MKLIGGLCALALIGTSHAAAPGGKNADDSDAKVAGAPKKKYKFEMKDHEMNITAEYSEGEKKTDDKLREKFEWRLQTTGTGFKLENKYHINSADTRDRFVFHSYVKGLKEFELNDVNDEEEIFFNQTVVNEYKLDKWNKAEYSADCVDESEEPCTATFSTEDDCFTVVVKANLQGVSGDGRVELSADDLKLDYKFGAGCPVGEGNALAVIGSVNSNLKTKNKKRASSGEIDGVDTETSEDGVSAHFNWLTEVDCGDVKRKVKAFTGEDGNDKEISWAIHKKNGDVDCIWDPVQGLDTGANSASALAPSLAALLAVAVALNM